MILHSCSSDLWHALLLDLAQMQHAFMYKKQKKKQKPLPCIYSLGEMFCIHLIHAAYSTEQIQMQSIPQVLGWDMLLQQIYTPM
jgi:hypothetical protein